MKRKLKYRSKRAQQAKFPMVTVNSIMFADVDFPRLNKEHLIQRILENRLLTSVPYHCCIKYVPLTSHLLLTVTLEWNFVTSSFRNGSSRSLGNENIENYQLSHWLRLRQMTSFREVKNNLCMELLIYSRVISESDSG